MLSEHSLICGNVCHTVIAFKSIGLIMRYQINNDLLHVITVVSYVKFGCKLDEILFAIQLYVSMSTKS